MSKPEYESIPPQPRELINHDQRPRDREQRVELEMMRHLMLKHDKYAVEFAREIMQKSCCNAPDVVL